MLRLHTTLLIVLFQFFGASLRAAPQPADHLVFAGNPDKPGKNKHIVLIAGDEEYRSEESLPMLAQILSHHGFRTTVLFSMDKAGQFVDPVNSDSISNPSALDSAEAIIMSIRYRSWSDDAMGHFHRAFERGVPIIALRTSTHPFKRRDGTYARYGDSSGPAGGWEHGFGRHVLGEKWVDHHGRHAIEGCRSVVDAENSTHPILTGVDTIFCRTDVYTANPRDPATILLRGEVTQTLDPNSPSVAEKNKPPMPIAWAREHRHTNGNVSKIFTTTMGSADDLTDINLRRLVLNAVYHNLGMEIPETPTEQFAALRSTFKPTMYGFKDESDGLRKGPISGQTPADFIDWTSPKHVPTLSTDDILPRTEQDLSNWQWIRPAENGYRFDRQGNLVFRSFPGNNWANQNPKGQNLLIQPFEHENAVVTLRLMFVGPSIQGDQAGMMFYCDDDHYLKTVREYMQRDQSTEILFVREQAGQGEIAAGIKSQPETVELRLVRLGQDVLCYYREKGQDRFKYIERSRLPDSDATLNLCLFATGCPSGAERDAVFQSLLVEPLDSSEAAEYRERLE